MTASAWAPAYCPSCRAEQRTTLFTKDEAGYIWGPECPRCHLEMRSTLLDLAGLEYVPEVPATGYATGEANAALGVLAPIIEAAREDEGGET
jgi:hypothetical protein